MEQLSIERLKKQLKEGKLELKSTHFRLCYPIIARIYWKMKIGIEFSGIKVDGDLIIDGHHRYLASLIAGISLDRYPSCRTSATEVTDWSTVRLDTEDWETEDEIQDWNEKDGLIWENLRRVG